MNPPLIKCNVSMPSYGTLGFLTLVTLQVVPYKPYVRLEYRPCYSLEETVACFDRETTKLTDNDSVEGIAFTKDTAVIMTGKFVDQSEVKREQINRMGRWYKMWFYQYVRGVLSGDGEVRVEYVPTLDFHQRHNKPCFWMSHIWLPWADGLVARWLTGMSHSLHHWSLAHRALSLSLSTN